MGTILSIGIHAQEAKVPQVFNRLLSRLLARGGILHMERFVKYSSDSKAMDKNEFLSNQETFINNLISSRDAIWIRIAYQLASGLHIGLYLECSGKGHNNGLKVRYDGHMQITVALNDLARPLKNALQQEQRPSAAALGTQGEQVIVDAEELFLRACSLLSEQEHDPDIMHGAMYFETGWPSAVRCSMVYHRAVDAFARDFGHIYAEHHWGVLPPVLFDMPGDLWTLTAAELAALRTVEPLIERPPRRQANPAANREEAEKRQFVDRLDRQTAQQLSVLPGPLIQRYVYEASQVFPRVLYHDFSDRGLALTADPLFELWRVYEYIAQIREATI